MNRTTARRVYMFAVAAILGSAALLDTARSPRAMAQESDAVNPYVNVDRRITPKQINRIRFMELRAAREKTSNTDDLRVDRIVATIPKDTIERFLSWKQGEPSFQGKRARQRFLKMTPPEKLAVIAYWARETPEEFTYADSIEIKTDPEILVEFRRFIMPALLTGCASSNCHANPDVTTTKMRLFNDPKRSDNTTYANFVTLREWMVNGTPLIDGRRPEESLLLSYTLRPDLTRDHHPGRESIKPIYQKRSEAGYQRLEKWLVALRQLGESDGYGFRLLPRPKLTTTAPADTLRNGDAAADDDTRP